MKTLEYIFITNDLQNTYKVELVSDNDGVQGWGVKIDKVRNIPFSIPSSLLNQN